MNTDDSEPLSAFDIDAANVEGTYQPQWGQRTSAAAAWQVSLLGWDTTALSKEDVLQAVERNVASALGKRALWHGATDPAGRKQTNNGHLSPGVFTSAVTGIPLFTTADLSLATSTERLRFIVDDDNHPHDNLAAEHVRLIRPDEKTAASSLLHWDGRTEVVEAK